MNLELKEYRAPWKGKLILVCRKCQKKLKQSTSQAELAKLKKTVKRHNKLHPDETLQLISVQCMKLCPRNGVTICSPADDSSKLVILRTAAELSLIAGVSER